MIDKAIGTIEVTRGYTFKLIADLFGGPKFENQDFFCAAKTQCLPGDEEYIADQLQVFSKRAVIKAVKIAINEYQTGKFPNADPAAAEPVPEIAPTPVQEAPAAAPPTEGKYHVAEKSAEPQAPPMQQPAPATASTPKPSKVIAERLKTQGITADELSAWVKYYFAQDGLTKYTQEQYVEAFTKAEEWITANSAAAFKANMATVQNAPQPTPATTAPTVPAAAVTDVFSDDPATREAVKQVQTKWPMWSPELVKIAALWCADHVKSADALDAVLVAAGITTTTSPGKIESFLAITRHLPISGGAVLIAYAKKTSNPVSMIESDLDKAVGSKIRFALDLPKDAVANAFAAMNEAAQQQGGPKK